jgi:transposase
MTETRKQYSKEFKLDAISLVLEQGFTRKEAAFFAAETK